jgi:undecaprenyl diphosphate synthase
MGKAASNPDALADLPRERWPRHIAIIMDGNGRWAERRGLPRIEGHRRGAKAVVRIIEEAARIGLEYLTLFAFSSENWRRSKTEINFLMMLYRRFLARHRAKLMRDNVRFVTIGRREGIPRKTLDEVDRTVEESAGNTGTVFCLAVNYGARQEIADAVRQIARRVKAGDLDPETITEETVAESLDTVGMPDPDLLVRTAGEMRISNFLLWQISYSELWVVEKCWPDFSESDLHEAVRTFASRERRFGRAGRQDEGT